MKVLVLSTRLPFIRGGAEELSFHLVKRLRDAGHEAEEMRIPFSWNPAERLIEEMMIARSLRVWNADRVIALKFPAYLIPHDNQVIWLLHQFRQAYDLFDAGQTHIERNARGDAIRAAIRTADEHAFRSAKGLYALPNAAKRLRHYNGMTANVLSQPLNDPELFTGGDDAGYIFAGGRIGVGKRQAMLVEALQHAPGVRLVVAGPPEDAGVPAALAALVNGCTASAYVPFDEDSVGYVTLEAFQSGKPVLTTTDSGGVLEIVWDGETGAVAAPTPEALGQAMAQLMAKRSETARLGAAGRALLVERDITWPKTLERLLS